MRISSALGNPAREAGPGHCGFLWFQLNQRLGEKAPQRRFTVSPSKLEEDPQRRAQRPSRPLGCAPRASPGAESAPHQQSGEGEVAGKGLGFPEARLLFWSTAGEGSTGLPGAPQA